MPESHWQPWKMTAIGMALVILTAVITGIVVANWTGREAERNAAAPGATSSPSPSASSQPVAPAVRPQPAAPASTPAVRPQRSASTVPTQAAIDGCNQYAGEQVGQREKTTEVVKDAVIGAVAGAAVGAAGGAIAGGGKGAGKGAAIGGVLGAGGGTLYGLNEAKKQDERYRDAYALCMRARGYGG